MQSLSENTARRRASPAVASRNDVADHFLDWPEVGRRTSLSRTTIWRLCRAGRFPSPVELSAGRVGWSARAVDAWIAARLQCSHNDEAAPV